MKSRSLIALSAWCLSAIACGDSAAPDSQPATTGASCEAALQHLDDCVANHCSGSDDAICGVLLAGKSTTLFDNGGSPCDKMSASEADELWNATCDDIIDDARLLATGKADFPCPAYFPWCNELAPATGSYHVNVLSSDATGASFEVLVGEVGQQPIVREGKVFQSLTLEGAGALGETGRPSVPTLSFFVGLPSTTDTVTVDSVQRDDRWEISDVTLAPYIQAAVEDAPPEPFVIDEAFYQQDISFPGSDYVVDPVSTWRNYRVVRVTVHPFQYNPAQKHLSAARRMVLQLSFLDNTAEGDDTVDTGETANAGAYGGVLVNYPETAGTSTAEEDLERVRYLVLAHDPLVEAIQPLVELKESQGIHTQVVTLSDVGAEPAKIKARIAQAYEESSIEYVLLVGDPEDLPMHVYELPWTSFYPDGDIPGDHWYGLLAGDDLLPEVSVGRMTGTVEEIASQVSKTIAYETGDPMASWRRKVLLVAHEEQYPDKYTGCAEAVRTREYKAGPVDFSKLYGGEHATAEEVVAELNTGVGVVGYRGHGSETAWLGWNGSDFSVGDHELENAAMTPVVFSVACLNAAAQEQAASHGEQWVRYPGGGAVAFLGATKRSWSPANDVFMKHLFQGMLDEGVTVALPLVNRARAEMIKQYGYDDSGPDNAMMYVWLGDPSLQVGQAFQTKAQTHVGWCNTQWPPELAVSAGGPSDRVVGQVWASGVTEGIGQGRDLKAEVGFGPTANDPGDGTWTWTKAHYEGDKGNNDEYGAAMTPTAAGVYSYVMRFKGAHDADWTYCDMDGNQNGFDQGKLGVLTVQ